MQTQEVAIKPNLKILLKPDTEVLDEVVVVAYGTEMCIRDRSIIWPPPDIWRWLETHQWKLDKTCPLLPNNGIFHQEL